MGISYKPLWHLLLEKDMKKTDLKETAKITSNIIARMSKNSYVDLKSIEKICIALNCSPNDVFEIINDKNENEVEI
jgi:DNA-binding Xre family transcriptional regulator